MNFKFILLLILISSCGVKGDPQSPTNQNLPSVLDTYPDIKVDQPLNDSEIKRK